MHPMRRIDNRGPHRRATSASRGSGLILALGILGMLAILATTFVTLMNVEARLTRIATDDLNSRLLAEGVVRYCVGVLRDDQDRSVYKYENRDMPVGGRPQWQGMDSYDRDDPKAITDFRMSIPGRTTDYWAPPEHRYGTLASNDVWYHSASEGYPQTGLYEASPGHYEWGQPSFGGGTGTNYDFCIVDRNDNPILDPADQAGPDRYYSFSPGHFNGLDDDGDGVVDEVLVGEVSALSAFVTMTEPPLMDRLDRDAKRGFETFREIG
ncbi:MAG TPA: hypothetical protein VMX57_04475, partial [Planctomycetota bacterium]|nr:hypothetical protein [Planctomycetota bacterium]